MKKYIVLGIILILTSIPFAYAGKGGLRISPAWPVMVESPYTFTVWAQSASSWDVHVLLVVTEECWDGMPDAPSVAVDITNVDGVDVQFVKTDFEPIIGKYVPAVPPATSGSRYQVSSLKDHLGEGLATALTKTDTIYWSNKSITQFDPLTTDPKQLSITLDSSAPRMLIYLMGSSANDGTLDMRVPPTPAGFMIPEIALGSVMAMASMFTALGLYIYKKKHKPTK